MNRRSCPPEKKTDCIDRREGYIFYIGALKKYQKKYKYVVI